MKRLLVLGLAGATTGAFAQLNIFENFDALTTPNLPAGWVSVNNSPGGPGSNPNWNTIAPAATPFTAHTASNYASSNFNASTGANAISNYMMTTVQTVNAGDTLSFWSRTVNTPSFPDRLSIVHNTNGSTTPGDFNNATPDLVINPNLTTSGYPNVWTQFNCTFLVGFTGRIAFWYNVPNGGPSGANSDFIGVDTITSSAVPEPATFLALGAGLALLVARRRR